jgi:hypothetical protein
MAILEVMKIDENEWKTDSDIKAYGKECN